MAVFGLVGVTELAENVMYVAAAVDLSLHHHGYSWFCEEEARN